MLTKEVSKVMSTVNSVKTQNDLTKTPESTPSALSYEYSIYKGLSSNNRLIYSIVLGILGLVIQFFLPFPDSSLIIISFELSEVNWILLIIGWIFLLMSVFLWRKKMVLAERESDWTNLKKKKATWVSIDDKKLNKYIEDYRFWKNISYSIITQFVIIFGIAIILVCILWTSIDLEFGALLTGFLGRDFYNFIFYLHTYPMIGYGGFIDLLIILIVLGSPPLIPFAISNDLTTGSVIKKYNIYNELGKSVKQIVKDPYNQFKDDLNINWEILPKY
ncbi:MAG: hypothetical protein ACFFD1_04855, partial [Candidatus Thorarchaeota archaeon]